MLDKDNNNRKGAVAKEEGLRATRANNRSISSFRDEVEDNSEELEDATVDGYQSAIAAVLGAILPRTAPLWYKMLVEEAFRPQGEEDAARLATAASLLHVVNPHGYMRW